MAYIEVYEGQIKYLEQELSLDMHRKSCIESLQRIIQFLNLFENKMEMLYDTDSNLYNTRIELLNYITNGLANIETVSKVTVANNNKLILYDVPIEQKDNK